MMMNLSQPQAAGPTQIPSRLLRTGGSRRLSHGGAAGLTSPCSGLQKGARLSVPPGTVWLMPSRETGGRTRMHVIFHVTCILKTVT